MWNEEILENREWPRQPKFTQLPNQADNQKLSARPHFRLACRRFGKVGFYVGPLERLNKFSFCWRFPAASRAAFFAACSRFFKVSGAVAENALRRCFSSGFLWQTVLHCPQGRTFRDLSYRRYTLKTCWSGSRFKNRSARVSLYFNPLWIGTIRFRHVYFSSSMKL